MQIEICFFYYLLQSRNVNKLIFSLVNDGVVATNSGLIQQDGLNFYHELFSNQMMSSVDSDLVFEVIPSLVSKKDNISLFAIPSDIELDSSSASSPYGFNSLFYHTCKDCIGVVAILFLHGFLTTRPQKQFFHFVA